MKHRLLAVAMVLTIGFLFALPAHADNLYASIKGTVADPTGAVMSGVKLTATNVDTGLSYSTTSDKAGSFSLLQLPIGNYKVRVEQTGFKTFQTTSIKLDLNEVYTLPVKLALGSVSEELLVEANPVQVEQTEMQLGTTITGQQIVDIPLNGRDWTQLQQLQPGVVGSTDRFSNPGNGGNGGYSGNGSETQQNAFLINGNDSNDAALNNALLIPSPDAIGEFRLVTNTLNPEYGRNSGTIVNAAIKNGTNSFHGDVFEFYRDGFLDAKNYFEKVRSPFHQNQFGGTIGGPIIKDHAFFFFSYEGLKRRVPQTGVSVPTVYSSAERGGNFSASGASFNGSATMQNGSVVVTNPKLSPFPLFGDSASTCPFSGGTPVPPAPFMELPMIQTALLYRARSSRTACSARE